MRPKFQDGQRDFLKEVFGAAEETWSYDPVQPFHRGLRQTTMAEDVVPN